FRLFRTEELLKFRFDSTLNQDQRHLRIGSTLHGFDQSHFAPTHNHGVHDIHGRIDDSPGDIGPNGSEQKLTNTSFAISDAESSSKRDRQHHNKTKQNFA